MNESTTEQATAADRALPGQGRGVQRDEGQNGRAMVGVIIVNTKQTAIGRVVDVVFDAESNPEFVVINIVAEMMAVPYAVANASKSENKIVFDEARLQAAPKIELGAWGREPNGSWRQDALRYWGKG